MWQLLLAAVAAAGSTGLVAKHLFSPSAKSCKEDEQNEKHTNPFDDDVKYQSPVVASGTSVCGYESNCEKGEGIFRFSSSESGGKSCFRSELKSVKKGGRGAKKTEKEKRSGGFDASKRRVAVCLKKRRTTKNLTAKNGSCSTEDNSLFHWGLGVGIMCMMSAGKSEITKLNIAVDETGKVVQELKSELSRRKSSRSLRGFCSQNELAAISEKIRSKHNTKGFVKSETQSRDANNIKVFGFSSVEDGECGSSILTDGRDHEVWEMDQLEAELMSELQKLPRCSSETASHEDMKLNKPEGHSSDCFQTHGVSPSELDQKLSRLLIKQQGNQIMDLESELQLAQSKLHEKEAELQVLQDCVKRLTEFSINCPSLPEDETEARVERQACRSEWDCNDEVEFESRQQVVGMKRHIDTEPWSYSVE